jgi:hypothetical protein
MYFDFFRPMGPKAILPGSKRFEFSENHDGAHVWPGFIVWQPNYPTPVTTLCDILKTTLSSGK